MVLYPNNTKSKLNKITESSNKFTLLSLVYAMSHGAYFVEILSHIMSEVALWL